MRQFPCAGGRSYLIIEGTGSHQPGPPATDAPLTIRNRQVISYWLQYKRGADFLTLDRGLIDFHHHNPYTPAEQMELTHWFGAAEQQVRRLPGAGTLPLWWAEFYASNKQLSDQAKAAVNASAYRSALLGGASVILLWQPMDTGEVGHALFTDARNPGGGAPQPLHHVVNIFNTAFKPGTLIVHAQSDIPTVEVLASKTALLLINKSASPPNVRLRQRTIPLAPYDVRLLPA